MLPNNSALNALASLCEKLETAEHFPQEKRKEAQELRLEREKLVERHPNASGDFRQQMEAEAEHVGIAMVGLLAQLLQVGLNDAGETADK